ncbi:pentapeptide repeat-containing protein [Streptosporangium sp. NPDC005286]|uniref:pentapeptide repeat-containing protein n=1 Tax=Streptosporangium sp. NPDC005286 TaxID=3154463 RepID=UPI0033B261D6
MVTSLGVVLSVLFTAGGLIYTGRTWETSQETLNATRETQITDRYTKAVEQLASKTIEVRLGGLYALNRIAVDSPKDASTIKNVMAAFARNRDFCKQKIGKRPCEVLNREDAFWLSPERLPVPTDVRAALELGASLKTAVIGEPDKSDKLDLRFVYFNQADLEGAYLINADLEQAQLAHAVLQGANLSGAGLSRAQLPFTFLGEVNLTDANLRDADLTYAKLLGAVLSGADLSGADLLFADLSRANLTGARLANVDLSGADLRSADLGNADLTVANLTGADLTGAKLAGADLRTVRGMTADQIRKVAITDATTKF